MLFATSILALALVATAWMMHNHHLHTIKQVEQHPEWDPRKRNFLLAQVHRRKKVTFTIMAIAAAVLLSPMIPENLFFVAYWGGICLLVMWIVVLAGVDMFATKTYILSLRDERIASRRALEEEVKRMREERASTEPPAKE
ncbi:hypothetical protein [Blastopirellula marina]|uniref:Uncharacterized protein n=1 Tax=Blastopirellula marina TaxID=124 RepID=A0A2S8F6K7_9BACT|nr:hypothetical protein [Blastopirellula marina]PQO27792.1 hypothetical protein C5Y98_27260 [Blastopirellula marina]PTL41532.1 hypothetical protein C5Y97_27275 [Blastopirellula marina]